MSKLEDLAVQKLSQMFDAISQAMPKVTQAVLDVTSWSCLIDKITLGVAVIVLGISSYCMWRYLILWLCKKKKDNPYEDWDFALVFATIGSGIISLGALICLLIFVCDVWTWVGIWRPDLYLIHQAMLRVGVIS